MTIFQNSGRSNSNSYNDHHQQQQASNVWTGPPSSQGNGRCDDVWTDNGGGRDYCHAAYTFGNVHASALPIASVSCGTLQLIRLELLFLFHFFAFGLTVRQLGNPCKQFYLGCIFLIFDAFFQRLFCLTARTFVLI